MTELPQKVAVFKSPFNQAKYNFIRRLSALTTVILFGLSFLYFFQDDFFFWPVIAGSLFAATTYIIVIKTKRIKLAGVFAILSINIIIVTKLLITSNFHYFEDFFWIMCLTIFAFFVLGKWWGIFTLAGNLAFAYIVFFLVRNGHFELYQRPYKPFDEVNFAINLIIGCFIFISIVLELLKQNRLSEQQYSSTHNELKIQHAEKTVMLREIHHRVKNNLQIVISLLRLQANEIEDQNQHEVFSESINRIAAIAKIHDRMYNNKSLSRINLESYLKELVNDLIISYGNPTIIQSEVRSNVETIDPKHLVPLALIFNELVTNSVKHAFRQKKDGLIRIEAEHSENKLLTLTYHDNGKWVEQDSDSSSIGLELIDSFVDQLDGNYSRDVSNGTTYTIQFELDT